MVTLAQEFRLLGLFFFPGGRSDAEDEVTTPKDSIETVTDALASGTDPISEEQKALDQPKPADQPAPEYVSKADFDAVRSELRGLQGRLDRTTHTLEEREAADRAALAKREVEALPEDQRALGAMVERRLSDIEGRISTSSGQRAAPTQEERNVVSQFGINPDDPRLDYSVLQQEGGMVKLIDKVYEIRAQPNGNQPAQPNAPPAQSPPTAQATTPRVGTPTQQVGPQTETEYTDAYITNKISRDEYEKGMLAIGATP